MFNVLDCTYRDSKLGSFSTFEEAEDRLLSLLEDSYEQLRSEYLIIEKKGQSV